MKLEKVKGALEWVGHGKLIFDVVIAVAGAKFSKALLVSFTKITEIWRGPIEWFSGALILGILLYVAAIGGNLCPPRRRRPRSILMSGRRSAGGQDGRRFERSRER